ncbi:hypothetical protein M426DRAFT_236151 [Hypoxylon sp. CI-4A]|nr:hypothetical protein M426DRAFT_236151 [Hypoxylon sp. CI-4A]
MAIRWLLSFVCLLAPLAVAQDYLYGDLLTSTSRSTSTTSVTKTITEFLAECEATHNPLEFPDSILPGTTTVTSKLHSTRSIFVLGNVTTGPGVGPTGFNPSQSVFNFTNSTVTRTSSSQSVLSISTPLTNATRAPCTTATVTIPVTVGASSTHSITSSIIGTSSVEPASISPTQIPISKSTKLGDGVVRQSFLGALGIILVLVSSSL